MTLHCVSKHVFFVLTPCTVPHRGFHSPRFSNQESLPAALTQTPWSCYKSIFNFAIRWRVRSSRRAPFINLCSLKQSWIWIKWCADVFTLKVKENSLRVWRSDILMLGSLCVITSRLRVALHPFRNHSFYDPT